MTTAEVNKETSRDVLDRYLVEHSMRRTPERYAILDVVVARRGVFSFDQIERELATTITGGISRSTIYDTINILIDASIIQKVNLPIKGTLYELCSNERHCHLICTACGKVKTVVDKHTDAFMNTKRYPAFNANSYHITVMGLCSTCSRKARKTKTND